DSLAASGMADQAADFLHASGKLQALLYKEDVESALRTPGMGGFQLLDLHDFPGQGTALVGVLDPFWDSKGYITPEEYHRFAGPTVPLLRMDKCIWTQDETFMADVEIAHFGAGPIENAQPRWTIADDAGQELARGDLPALTIPISNGTALGPITCSLANVAAPKKLVVTVELADTTIRNSWDIWVYPPKVDTAPTNDILVAESLDENTLKTLAGGGKVLLLPAPGSVAGDQRGPVPAGFSPIFWNTFWTRYQPPHTLGILCDPKHPALAEFPTEFHSNWQWWDLIHGGQIMILDGLPAELRPVVQVIDDWTTNRRLGLAIEARVGGGRLLVCSSDLAGNLDARPVARQMRRSLLDYMASDAFQPAVEVSAEALSGLFAPPPVLRALGATATADSDQPGYEAALAIDGNPTTFWHSTWEGSIKPYPHWLAIDLQQTVHLQGVTLLPRQDMTNGRIGRCFIYVSADGKDWGKPVARGRFKDGAERQTVMFRQLVDARHVKIEALDPVYPDHPWATLAEVDVVITPDK
ncbi:MAG: hypothetical protein QG656_2747, partial [Candidatus Hydrogenedentes bacterium]|nr:hypothetical protein [Candidatus Hydrogenedentota bacterium]